MKEPKYRLGQDVISKVDKRGSYEPSICKTYEKTTVNGIQNMGGTYRYTCGYDGYEFLEDEIMSIEEFKKSFSRMSK